jgi:hypothetical protein
MTYAIGDPDHIEVHESIRLLFMAAGLDPDLIPGTATIGATGHVDDHNKIADALAWLDENGVIGGRPVVNEGSSTGATFSDLTNPDGDGKNYRLAVWNGNGTLVVTTAGLADVLVLGGGGANNTYGGSGGRIMLGKWKLPAGTLNVVVGAGAGGGTDSGAGQNGGYSSLNEPQIIGGGGNGGWNYMTGAMAFYGGGGQNRRAYPSSITGTSVDYGRGSQGGDSSPVANRGMGSLPGGAGSSGVVIARWER